MAQERGPTREQAWGELLDALDDAAMRALLTMAADINSLLEELRVQIREEQDLIGRRISALEASPLTTRSTDETRTRLDHLETWLDNIEHEIHKKHAEEKRD